VTSNITNFLYVLTFISLAGIRWIWSLYCPPQVLLKVYILSQMFKEFAVIVWCTCWQYL
jgi:hypothetical protein